MRLETEVTVEDFVDASERVLARSRVARSWRHQGAAGTALLSALITGVLGFMVVGKSIAAGLVGGAIAALVGAAVSWNVHHNTVRRRLRNYFLEQFGGRDSIPYEVELSESGLSTRQLGTRHVFEWANVEEVEETGDAIAFYTFGGGAVFVRKRAFKSPEEERAFIDAAERYRNISRTSSNWRNAV